MSLPEPRLNVVIDPEDTPAHARLLATLPTPDRSRILCAVTPAQPSRLNHDLARSLGKRQNHVGSARNSVHEWRQLQAWCIASRVQVIIVSRAHLLDSRQWRKVIDLVALAQCELWMVCQVSARELRPKQVLTRWPWRRWDWAGSAEHWSKAANPTSGPPAGSGRDITAETEEQTARVPFPRVADEDFPLFRARCRQLLCTEDFAVVDATFLHAARATEHWWPTHQPPRAVHLASSPPRTEMQPDDAEELAAFLRSQLDQVTTADEAMTRLRGAQVALFRRGILIRVDVDNLLAGLDAEIKSPITTQTAETIRRYRSPRHAAAAALRLSTDLSVMQLRELNVGDVSSAGDVVRYGGCEKRVAPLLRDIVRAQQIDRLLQGGGPEDPLFVTEAGRASKGANGPVRMTAHGLQVVLRHICNETGLLLLRRGSGAGPRNDAGWLRRVGVSIKMLTTEPAVRPATSVLRGARTPSTAGRTRGSAKSARKPGASA